MNATTFESQLCVVGREFNLSVEELQQLVRAGCCKATGTPGIPNLIPLNKSRFFIIFKLTRDEVFAIPIFSKWTPSRVTVGDGRHAYLRQKWCFDRETLVNLRPRALSWFPPNMLRPFVEEDRRRYVQVSEDMCMPTNDDHPVVSIDRGVCDVEVRLLKNQRSTRYSILKIPSEVLTELVKKYEVKT